MQRSSPGCNVKTLSTTKPHKDQPSHHPKRRDRQRTTDNDVARAEAGNKGDRCFNSSRTNGTIEISARMPSAISCMRRRLAHSFNDRLSVHSSKSRPRSLAAISLREVLGVEWMGHHLADINLRRRKRRRRGTGRRMRMRGGKDEKVAE